MHRFLCSVVQWPLGNTFTLT
uniref:Uncharacterized protein n=1 Tax=Anguilla anguilla TaxID=7936 RepID=A0A0E9VQU6_ANGAN